MCKHERTVIETTGGWRVNAKGEAVDNAGDRLFCLDCLQEVDQVIESEDTEWMTVSF